MWASCFAGTRSVVLTILCFSQLLVAKYVPLSCPHRNAARMPSDPTVSYQTRSCDNLRSVLGGLTRVPLRSSSEAEALFEFESYPPAEMSCQKVSTSVFSETRCLGAPQVLTNSITSEQEADAAQRALSKNFGHVRTYLEVGRSSPLIGSSRRSVERIWTGTSTNSSL